jgi:hypothetical protein
MTENRIYSEADVVALKKEWETEAIQRDIVKQIAEIKGQLTLMPGMMEATARRVIAEVLDDQHKLNASERTEHAKVVWNRAPAVMQGFQFVLAIGLAILGYFAGKGHIP